MFTFTTRLFSNPCRHRTATAAALAISMFFAGSESGRAQEFQAAVWPEIVDASGNPITSVGTSGEFMLRVYAEDLRPVPDGVFAAYVDIPYDDALVALNGSVVHGPLFPNVVSAHTTTAGLLDDFGGAGLLTPSGGGPLIVFEQPMTALAPGDVEFSLKTGGSPPFTDILLYSLNDAVPVDQIQFGSTSLAIVPEPSSAGLLGIGLVMLLRRRRSRG